MKLSLLVNLVALLVFLASCTSSDNTGLPSLEVPHTFGIQTKSDNVDPGNLEKMKDVGFGFIRRGFYWYGIEKEKGIYDFTEYDSLYQNASSRNLRIYAVLYGGNSLYEDDGQGGIQTEEGRRGFANFAAALAGHYKDKGIIWEIWNEPNIGSFWRRGEHNTDAFAKEYTALVKEVVPAMHTADPRCIVIAGSVSALWEPSFNWMRKCFEEGMLGSGINGWSIHPYSHKTPEEQASGYERVRNLLSEYGAPADFPLLNSERGFSLDSTRREGWTGGLPEKADEYMARHLVRQYFVDLMSGIRLSIYYEWQGDDFGINWQGVQRPAYYASSNVVKQLAGFSLKERLETDSDLDYLLVFENSSGGRKLVAWTAPPPGKDPEQAVKHAIRIPVGDSDRVMVSDIFGKQSVEQVKDGEISLMLEGGPQYISL